MRFRIKYADRIVGLFILVALLLVLGLMFLLGGNQNWFVKQYRFTSRFASAGNIPVGTGLMFRGFEMGKINSVNLAEDNLVDVVFMVEEEYISRVTKDSVLELSVSPIGLGTSLLFHQGLSADLAEEGSYIPSLDTEAGRDLVGAGLVDMAKKDDTISRLLGNVNGILENANRTIILINQAIEGKGGGAVKSIMNNADQALVSLNTALLGAQTLMTQLQTQIGGVLTQTDIVMGDVGGITKQVNNGLPDILKKVDTIMLGLAGATRDVQKLMSGLSGEVPKVSVLLADTQKAILQAQDVMEGLRNNPLLKGGISERPNQDAVIQSLRREEF